MGNSILYTELSLYELLIKYSFFFSYLSHLFIHFECAKKENMLTQAPSSQSRFIQLKCWFGTGDVPFHLDNYSLSTGNFFPSVSLKWAICSFENRTESFVCLFFGTQRRGKEEVRWKKKAKLFFLTKYILEVQLEQQSHSDVFVCLLYTLYSQLTRNLISLSQPWLRR